MKNYLAISPGTKKEGQKTYTYCVFSAGTAILLGVVKWRTGWRRYAFEPEVNTVFDSACLTEMAQFLDQQTAMQKRKRDAETSSNK